MSDRNQIFPSPANIFKDSRQIKGIVLVNPATSYDRSHWRVVGSLVANAPGLEAFGMAATLALATTIPDTSMVGGLRIEASAKELSCQVVGNFEQARAPPSSTSRWVAAVNFNSATLLCATKIGFKDCMCGVEMFSFRSV